MNQGVKPAVDMLDDAARAELLRIVRATVSTYVTTGQVPEFEIKSDSLHRTAGAFVTLHRNGGLRGCIGQIIPSEAPLWEVVRDMAIAAASEDPRFEAVRAAELADLEYEVSVLTTPRRIADWRDVELGRHGVIIRRGGSSGVFLPQVADDTGWTREEFLGELCAQKAGLPRDCYRDPETVIEVFEAIIVN